MSVVGIVFFVGAASFGLAANAGQLFRTFRHGAAGVSAWSWTLISAVGFSWAADFLFRGLTLPAVVNVVLSSIALAVASRCHGPRFIYQLVVVISLPTFVALAASYSLQLSAVVVSFATLAMYTPQFMSVLVRYVKRASLDGVSAGTWVLNALISVSWLGWGAAVGVWHAAAVNTVLAVLAATTALLTFFSRNPRRELYPNTQRVYR